MNDNFVIEKQSAIMQICLSICKHSTLSGDLAQEVSIWFLTHKLPDYITDGFIYTLAYKAFHLSGSEFRRLHIDDVINQSVDIGSNNVIKSIDKQSVDAQLKQIMKELTPTEQIWAEEIMKRNCSIRLFSQHTGISRQKATERINEIYTKIRNNG